MGSTIKLIVFFLILIPIYVSAIIVYPSQDCIKPDKPVEPYSFDIQWEIDAYNSEVEICNMELEQYINCIGEYVENANDDMQEIKRKAQEAIDDISF